VVFNSLDFAVFLIEVFALYWFVFNKNLRVQNAFVVAASYFFYGWWDWRFLILIAITTFTSYIFGLWTAKYRDKARWILLGSIVLNLGILFYFKYFNFFIQSFVEAFSLFGKELTVGSLKIILPVGISFYTFQALSYSIDVYKRKIEPTRDIAAYFAFIGFFPLLVAGPIERATNMLPQFYVERKFNYPAAVDGMRQILWGLFKKIVIADNCCVCADHIFANHENLPGSTLAIGALFFTVQIYCDFSGYSDIAVGVARLFGFNAMRNFAFPYFSRDIAEFWRRWHVSLTTWFRDYVYIPLGGSRCSKAKVVRNTMVIFLLSGFWHGANWTFIAWGAFHAILFLPLILLGQNRKYTDIVAANKLLPNVREFFQILITVLLTAFGWIFFRAENIRHAALYISEIFSSSFFAKPYAITYGGKFIIPLVALFFLAEWLQRGKQHALQFDGLRSKPVRWAIYIALIILIFNYGGVQAPFVYFQF
jgi:D-alanyl-lipoteichoic acid acyltransferase DltB (MBOAT superfamily)